MSDLFGRTMYVEVGRKGSSQMFIYGQHRSDLLGNEFGPKELDVGAQPQITADITKNLADKNTARFSLFNLARSRREELETADIKKYYIKVYAGYNKDVFVLFSGDVTKSGSTRNGADWVTTIEATDGLDATSKAKTSKSFPPNKSYKNIIEETAKSFGTDFTVIVKDLAKNVAKNGFSFTGLTEEMIKKITVAMPEDVNVNIQGNKMYIMPARTLIDNNQIADINKNSGMIGVPNVTSKGLTIRSLLQEGLFPGMGIRVTSELNPTANGIYVIQKSKINAETRGPQWFVDIDAVLAKNVKRVVS